MYDFVVALLRPYTLLWLILVATVIHLWCRRRETRGRLVLLTIPVAALHLLSTPLVAHLALGSLEWQYPPLHHRPADCQAIVVLAAGIHPADAVRDRPELADDTRLRCLYAAELYRQGPACPILVSGGNVHPDDPPPPHAEVMAAFLRRHGVPAADLIVEAASRTTYENAVESTRELKRRGLDKVVLVADAVDLRRAVDCFARQGISVTPAASSYGAKPFEFSLQTLLPSVGAARNCERVGHEWLGIAWYRVNGRI